jgi:hypothetical protein
MLIDGLWRAKRAIATFIKITFSTTCIFAAGCAPLQSADLKPPHRPLNASSLESLFSNVSVEPERPIGSIVGDAPGEVFLSNGVYFRNAGRTRVEGSFRIRGSSLCVELPSVPEWCRTVIDLGHSRFRFIDNATGTPTVLIVTPLR